ncbi:amino acid ABC transporter permease [Paenirhodobacter populi]|uniref:Amino acid ABC transporter permease n=1 Tax=Paenirhodobacter populi TaxID=2306993 RepID=A0A443JC34_9RHOB|nr:amino acid ABC transporter permease [Sinirhodobacter populi]RWR05339.1 amino acid ABC transporter permease [Sinirhodobacter populi]RWR15489.1 amino acid ABC transporter permease [Sinirhodobacter populi]RWR18095.1 amino acid ABC transporter permease [Sinirhodobacter populi]RWR28363.1 amino acid ABC transporter permease [Sinirhodobacter populi]
MTFAGLTPNQLLFILQGAGWTVILSLLGFVGGSVIGLPAAVGRISKNRLLRFGIAGYINLIQGIPLPIIMFLCYFGMSIAGFSVPALVAAAVAMTAYCSAYLAEIWRGALMSVPKAQWEAAECLALKPFQRLTHVILPQAVRISIAPTVGFLVQIVKNSSYAVVIGFAELTYTARLLNNSTFRPFVIFSIAALLYFAICYPLSLYSRRLERRLKRG